MDKTKNEIIEYALSFKQKSRLKLSLHIIYITLTLSFGAMVIFISKISEPNDGEAIFAQIFLAIGFMLFLVLWVCIGVLKINYIELTEEHIEIRSFYKRQFFYWKEIYNISIYEQNHNTMLGIILKEKMRKRKKTFFTELSDSFGGSFSAAISFSLYPDINVERLYLTMSKKIAKAYEASPAEDYTSSYRQLEGEEDLDEKSKVSNFLIAIFKSLIASISIGIAYGFSIYLLKVNIIIIPIFGLMGIMYIYNKNYTEKKINFILRIIIGLVSSVQVFVGTFTAVYLAVSWPFTISNLNYIVRAYVLALVSAPLDQFPTLFIALIVFIFGAMQGYKFKFQRSLGKITMKKVGKYYYKRDGKFATIYFIDPKEYDDTDRERLMAVINEGCLLETNKRDVKAFYIKASIIEGIGFSIVYDSIVEIDNEAYFKLDLGGTDTYRNYVFPCSITLNGQKKAETLNIQLK